MKLRHQIRDVAVEGFKGSFHLAWLLVTAPVAFIRRLLHRCDHNWSTVKRVKLNEFDAEDPEYIVSASEFSMQRCVKCKDIRFQKL